MGGRFRLTAVALIGGIALAPAACANRPSLSPWCAVISDFNQTHCDYETLQQCLKTVSALGGLCLRNPRLTRHPEPPPKRQRRP